MDIKSDLYASKRNTPHIDALRCFLMSALASNLQLKKGLLKSARALDRKARAYFDIYESLDAD